MKTFQRVCLIGATVLCLGLSSTLYAITLHEAKGQGLLGEMPNGYLGVVNPPGSPEVQALQKSINRKRRAKYQEIAKRNGTKLSAVEILAGKTALEKTEPGHFIKLPSGQWSKK